MDMFIYLILMNKYGKYGYVVVGGTKTTTHVYYLVFKEKGD
jgi:hypothetical protein